MYCINCGKMIDDDSVFCIHCGTEVKVRTIIQEKAGSENKQITTKSKKRIAFVCLLIMIAVIATVIVIVVSGKSRNNGSADSPSNSSSTDYEMSHETYCLLYLDVSDVKVKHDGNYTYVSGKLNNNGSYSIKYVKVKAVCKDYSGGIVDTDWTYAVGSTWLEPGECVSFEMMIKDTDYKIKTADVSVVWDN